MPAEPETHRPQCRGGSTGSQWRCCRASRGTSRARRRRSRRALSACVPAPGGRTATPARSLSESSSRIHSQHRNTGAAHHLLVLSAAACFFFKEMRGPGEDPTPLPLMASPPKRPELIPVARERPWQQAAAYGRLPVPRRKRTSAGVARIQIVGLTLTAPMAQLPRACDD